MTKKTEVDERAIKLPKTAAWLKLTQLRAWAAKKGGRTATFTRWVTVPALFTALVLWSTLVLVKSFLFGWVDDLPAVFKHEDDTDLRRKFVWLRWVSIFNTAVLAAMLAAVAPATILFSVLVIAMAVTNRITAHVRVRKLKPGATADSFAPSKGFVKPRREHYDEMVWHDKNGEVRGSFFWMAVVLAVLTTAFAFISEALATEYLWLSEGIRAALPADFAWVTLVLPSEVRFWLLVGLGALAVTVAAAGGRVAGLSLRKVHGHDEAYRQALREKLVLVLGQESASGQRQFMSTEDQGLLKMVRMGAEWEITLPTHLWPVLRDEGALRRAVRRELDNDQLNYELVQVWEGHFSIGPVGPKERRIRDNLRASGGTPENGGLEKGLTEDDLGFDDPNGHEELLPRDLLSDLTSWEATAKAAASFAELGLQLVGYNGKARKGILEPTATATPRARWKQLNLPVGASDRTVQDYAERLARWDDAVVLEVDKTDRRVLLSPMLPAVAAERETIATELKADLTKVGVAVTWSTEGRAESIDVETRAVSPDPDAAREQWRKVINAIHGGSNGWLIHPDPVRGVTTLVYGEPRSLPALVSVADLLPAATGLDAWNQIPLGRGSRGELVTWDMEAGVHALIVGPTGSGKSIQLLDIILGVLATGGDVVVIDGSPKRGADFMKVRDFTRAWADNPLDASNVLESVYAEGRRRADLVLEYGGASWHDIPAEVRERERVAPLVAVVDEYAALTALRDIPKGADKEDPKVLAAQEVNAAKSNVMMVMDDITREMRFVGIRVVLGLQRGDASILSGFMRNNFPTKIQLKTPNMPLDPAGLRMMFPGEYGVAAEEEFRALDNGSPGLGVTAQEGGMVTGYRGGFIKAEGAAIRDLISTLGVAVPPPLMPLSVEAAPAPRQSPAPVRQPVPAERKPVPVDVLLEDDFIL